MLEKPVQERRKTARPRVLKGAQITFQGHWVTIDCTVRNLSNSGACLKVQSPIGIPDAFDLVLDSATVVHCRVIWRKATKSVLSSTN